MTRPAPRGGRSRRPGRRLREWAAFAGALGTGLAVLYHRLLLGAVIFSRDAGRLYYPVEAYAVARLRHGQLPLWFPFEAMGTPFIGAGVTGVFHPFTWLGVLLGPVLGHAAATLGTIVVLATGTWLAARQLGASRAGAALALVVAIGGGSFVSTLDNRPFAWSIAALPYLVLGTLWTVRRPDRTRGILVVAGAVAWAVLAGDFEAAYLFGLLGLGIALVFRKMGPLRAVLRLGAGGALGLGLGAVQLFPSASVFRHIARASGLPWTMAAEWSMHWLRLPELFLGDLIHDVLWGSGPTMGSLVAGASRVPWQLTVFLGAAVLVGLAALVVAGPGRRTGAWIAGVGALCLWGALGRFAGLYGLAYHLLPFWNAFRYPEKLLPYTQVLLALAAGVGVTTAWRRPRRAAIAAFALAGALLVASPVLAALAPADAPRWALWCHRASRGALEAAAVASLLGLVWYTRWRGRLGRLGPLLATLPVLVTLVQLGPVDGRLLRMMSGPATLLTTRSVGALALARRGVTGPGIARITTYRGTPVGLAVHDPDYDFAHGFVGRVLWDEAALQPDYGALAGVETTLRYLPVVTPRYLAEIDDHPLRWLTHDSAIFDGRFESLDPATYDHLHQPTVSPVLRSPGLGLVIAENHAALPRAFVTTPRFVASGEAARAALARTSVATGRMAVIEGPPAQGQGDQPLRSGPGTARIVSYRPEAVVVDATLARPGVLVLNDAFFPGWVATVDGRPARIRRANYLVRGVLLGQGHHRITFRFPVPAPLWAGAATSLVAALVVALLALLARGRSVTPTVIPG